MAFPWYFVNLNQKNVLYKWVLNKETLVYLVISLSLYMTTFLVSSAVFVQLKILATLIFKQSYLCMKCYCHALLFQSCRHCYKDSQ